MNPYEYTFSDYAQDQLREYQQKVYRWLKNKFPESLVYFDGTIEDYAAETARCYLNDKGRAEEFTSLACYRFGNKFGWDGGEIYAYAVLNMHKEFEEFLNEILEATNE